MKLNIQRFNQTLKSFFYGIFFFSLFLTYPQLSSADCAGVFLAPVQSNCGNVSSNCNTGNPNCGCVTFKGNVVVNNNPVGSPVGSQIPTPSLVTNNNTTCNSGVNGQAGNNSYACSSTGSAAAQINPGSFQATGCTTGGCNITVSSGTVTLGGNNQTDYGDIVVNGGTLIFTSNNFGNNGTVYRMNNLTINGGTVQFAPGDYWVAPSGTNSGLTVAASGVTFTSSAPGVIRMFSGNDITWGGGNGFPAITSGSAILVFSYGNISIQGNGNYTGAFYAVGNVSIGGGEIITGAVSGGTVTASNGNPTFNYDSQLISILQSSVGTCGGDHFTLAYPSIGSRCQPWTLSVTMTKSDGTVDTTYGTGVAYPKTFSVQVVDATTLAPIANGTWSTTGKGSLVAGNNTGAAQYTFAQAVGGAGDQGVVNLQLSYPTGPASIRVFVSTVNDPTIIATAYTSPITFTQDTFNILFPTPVKAGQTVPVSITAVAAPSCVPLTAYTGPKTVQLWTQYLNPSSGTQAASVNGSPVTNCKSSGDPSYTACSAGATTQSLNFVNGVATVNFVYPDVGTLALNAADISKGGPSGQSSTVVVPAQFVVTNYPGTCNASAVTTLMSQPYFQKAGNNFGATVQVQNVQGNVTPNFGNETPAESVKLLAANLIAPVGGHNGSKNDGNVSASATVSKTSPGVYQISNVTYDEVGIITLQAGTASGSYQGVALTSTQEPQSGCVGRFVPDHFDLTQKGAAPVFATGCQSGAFNYVGQPIAYQTNPVVTVTAKAKAGTITQNYTNFYSGYQFWRLDPTQTPALGSINQTYTAGAFPLATYSGGFPTSAVTTAFNATNTTFSAGADTGTGARDYTFSFNPGSGIVFPKLTGATGQVVPGFTGEVSFGLGVTDADNITNATAFNIGQTTTGNGISFANSGKTFYQGRMSLANVYGSELLPLTVPITIQYYDGVSGNWLTNAADSCTAFSNIPIQANMINAVVAGQGTGASGTLNTTPTFSNSTFSAGVTSLNLSSPGKGNNGYVDVEPNLSPTGYNLPWLQYDWPQAGAPTKQYSNNPFGRGTFGIYKGSGNIIFRQRVVQ